MHAYLDILFVYPYISWWALGVIFALSSYEQCCYENLYIVFMGAFVVIHFRGEFLGYLVTLTFKRRTDCFLKWQQCFRFLLMIHEGFTSSYMFTVNVCYCISCLCTHTRVHVYMWVHLQSAGITIVYPTVSSESFFLFFCGARDQTQGHVHAKQMF